MFSCSLWHKQNALIWFLSTAPFSVREHTLLCVQNDWTPDCNSGRTCKRSWSLICWYVGLLCLLSSTLSPTEVMIMMVVMKMMVVMIMMVVVLADSLGEVGGKEETRAEEKLLKWFKDTESRRVLCIFVKSILIRHDGHTEASLAAGFCFGRGLKLGVKWGDRMWMGRIMRGWDGRRGCVTARELFPVDQNHVKWC